MNSMYIGPELAAGFDAFEVVEHQPGPCLVIGFGFFIIFFCEADSAHSVSIWCVLTTLIFVLIIEMGVRFFTCSNAHVFCCVTRLV